MDVKALEICEPDMRHYMKTLRRLPDPQPISVTFYEWPPEEELLGDDCCILRYFRPQQRTTPQNVICFAAT